MLFFVDESGIDLKKSPFLVLAGVGVRAVDVWPLAQKFLELRKEILRLPEGSTYEAKGNKLLKARVFRQAGSTDVLAIDERDAAVESMFEKNSRGIDVSSYELAAFAQAKLEFVSRALDLADSFGVKTFATMVPRDAPQQRDETYLRKDFAYLFQRFHCHVCDQHEKAHGIMIFDEQDRALSQTLLDQIHRYFVGTVRGRQRAEKLVPMPFFVHSDLTPAIQIADLTAYIFNWGLRMPSMKEPSRKELHSLADKVFGMRYRGQEVRLGDGSRGAKIWGVSYIKDLRPRDERGDDLDK